MPCLLSRRPAEGWRQGACAALYGGAALLVAAVAVQPVAAEEVDELKSEMRQLLDRIDQLEQNQQQTQVEVDQLEANSVWTANEPAVRARATAVNYATTQGDYVSGGDFPGSFKLPGSDTSMAWYGFIKADFIHDFGPLRALPQLVAPALLPTRGAAGASLTNQTNFRVNPSQLNIETRTPSEYGEIRTLFQFDDFFADIDGGPNQSTVNENALGIRLAQGTIGPWTFGQHWTSAIDLSQYAETMDYENLNAAPLCRCTAVTYADSLGGGWSFGVSVVDPVTQIDLTGGTVGVGGAPLVADDRLPDLQGNIKYAQDWGHIFLGGQLREIGYIIDDAAATGGANAWRVTTGKAEDHIVGWSLTLGLNMFDPFGLHPRDRFYTNATYGEGVRGIIDESLFCFSPLSGGLGCVLEATVNPITGDLDANSNFAFMAHYQHWWTDTIRSYFIYGLTRNSPGNDFDSIGTIRRTQYAVVNLVWSPVPRFNIGIETQYAEAKFKNTNATLDGNDTIQAQVSALFLF